MKEIRPRPCSRGRGGTPCGCIGQLNCRATARAPRLISPRNSPARGTAVPASGDGYSVMDSGAAIFVGRYCRSDRQMEVKRHMR